MVDVLGTFGFKAGLAVAGFVTVLVAGLVVAFCVIGWVVLLKIGFEIISSVFVWKVVRGSGVSPLELSSKDSRAGVKVEPCKSM